MFTQALSQETVFSTDTVVLGAHLRFYELPPSVLSLPVITLRNISVGEKIHSSAQHIEMLLLSFR